MAAYFRDMRTTTGAEWRRRRLGNRGVQWGYPFVYSTPGKNASFNLTFIPSPNLINELNVVFAGWNETYPSMKELDAFWRDFAVRDATGQMWMFEHSSAHEGATM